jgi:AP-3 complex subunit delta-1
MLGYNVSFAEFHILEAMSSTKFVQKRVGYLAAIQIFGSETEALLMASNLLKKDLSSLKSFDVGKHLIYY